MTGFNIRPIADNTVGGLPRWHTFTFWNHPAY